ncbi:MAG TPA: hypothetical protein VEF04_19415, partial [Blastocatellia bacterium]|nr:hypothetical protein [Blastocatellia bacterium]
PKQEGDDFESLVKDVCASRGWDINALDANQKAYIKDLIALSDAVFQKRADKFVGSRLKPVESYIQSTEQSKQTDKSLSDARSLAEKYKIDFDKDLMPLLANVLDDLDKKDPSGTRIKFDVVQWAKDTVLELLNEKANSQARQEVRNDLKKNAKPLTPRSPIPSGERPAKGKSVLQTANAYLDTLGLKD